MNNSVHSEAEESLAESSGSISHLKVGIALLMGLIYRKKIANWISATQMRLRTFKTVLLLLVIMIYRKWRTTRSIELSKQSLSQ